jgi:ABC-type multidrug transport system ATPase subunit/cell division protein FtsL
MSENINEFSKLIDKEEEDVRIPRTRAQKVVLKWEKIKLIKCGSDHNKKILKSLSGFSNPQEVLAVIGPRGSGKTSLLKVLSNTINLSKHNFDRDGQIYLNNHNIFDLNSNNFLKYLKNPHHVHGTLNVFEYFTCNLTLKSHLTSDEVKARVDRVIEELKLQDLKEKIMSSSGKNALTEGQRRKVIIAGEVMLYPSVLMIDEALSGLDHSEARGVLTLLKDSLAYGVNVVVSGEITSYENFQMFDRLILMQEGWIVYQGKAMDSIQYFNSLGMTLPKLTSPAEHFIKLLKVEDSENYTLSESKTLFFLKEKYEKTGTGVWKDANLIIYLNGGLSNRDFKTNLFKKIRVLLWRNWISFKSLEILATVKILQVLAALILLNLTFVDLGLGSEGLTDRKGLVVVLMLVFFLVSSYSTCFALMQEIKPVRREIKEKLYSVQLYLICKVFWEAPVMVFMNLFIVFTVYFVAGLNLEEDEKVFVLALVVTIVYLIGIFLGMAVAGLKLGVQRSLAVLSGLTCFFIVFSGFFSEPESEIRISYFLRHLSPLYFLRDAAFRNEFDYLDIESGTQPEPEELFNYNRDTFVNIGIACIHLIVLFLIACILLNRKS